MKKPFLIGERLYLRPLELSDVDGDYPSWLNDPIVCAQNRHQTFPYTIEQAKAYIESVRGSQTDLVLAIVDKKMDLHIGNISLQAITLIHANAELAIIIGNTSYWGKGYGQEACSLMINHGFNALRLHRIYCYTSAANIAMQRICEACGMKKEGVQREAFYKHGRFYDVIEYAILAHEWDLKEKGGT